MSGTEHASRSERVYSALLHLLPRRFRARFAIDMRACFRDLHRDMRRDMNRDMRRRRGHGSIARLWLRLLADLLACAVREHALELWDALRGLAIPDPSIRSTQSPGDGMLETLAQDVRFSWRTLRKSPVFTVVVVAVVALGIGSVATVFSAANAIVFRPIPGVARTSELVELARAQGDGRGSLTPSYPYYRAMRERTKTLSALAAWAMMPITVSDSGEGVTAFGNLVSANYFDVLGVRPEHGRFFVPAEDRTPGDAQVVVISHGFWQRHFAGNPGVVGRSIRVNGHPFTIVGITPPEFRGVLPIIRTDVWVPMMMQRNVRSSEDLLSNAGAGWLTLFGRLAPGVPLMTAQAELNALAAQWSRSDGNEPKFMQRYTTTKLTMLTGLPSDGRAPALAFAALLLAVSSLVLFIAASNVAGMLLARAVSRRREIAVRLALGAGRLRLVRQLITESLVLYLMGAALGLVLAWWGTAALGRIQLPVGVEVPIVVDVAPDYRVLIFSLAAALVAGLAFGLVPALHSARGDVASTLRSDTAGGGGQRSRVRNVLVTAQIAMSLLLLMSAGLFTRALERGQRVDPGFIIDNVVTATIDLEAAGYDETRGRQFLVALRDRIAADPSVRAVSYTRMLPLTSSSSGTDVKVDGSTAPESRDNDNRSVSFSIVDVDYFKTVRMPLVQGRAFEFTDHATAARVAVVNEAFVDHYWHGQNAIGHSVHYDNQLVTIVGVARNAKYANLHEELAPFMYLPQAQNWRSSTNLLVSTTGDPRSVVPVIRTAARALDRMLPAPEVVQLAQATAVALLPQRIAAAVSASLGSIGLLLAAVGLYGVIAFAVNQRTREIGIRLALGADGGSVVRLMVREGMRHTIIGIAIGMALAAAGTQVMKPFLFGVSPLDPVTFVAIPAVLALVALLASYIPARRAAWTDPAISLRND